MKKTLLFIFSLALLNLTAQHCWPPTASIDIDINNIRAKLLNGGDMWWDGVSAPAYQYPKVDTSTGEIPKNLFFTGALWITALNENNELKCAAQTYRNQGYEFWPGPIVFGSNTIADTECTKFDRFFPILRTELDAHIASVNSASQSLSWTNMSDNVKQWPGKGNAYLQAAYNMEIVDDLAPFQDCNGNGIYDPANGDYPLMKGDQSIFWVINDIGNVHGISGGDPLGVEIQCMAYAYITNDVVNDATFYDYKIIKKTAGDLHDFYFSQFIDPDLIGYADDYIGCDTTLEYAFCYNAEDPNYGENPIIVTQFSKTPNVIGLSSFSSLGNFNIGNAANFKNSQIGLHSDGSPITCGGTGIGGINSTNFMFSGNPSLPLTNESCENWSECSAGTIPGDRLYQMSTGPYTLNATDALEFTLSVIVTVPNPNTYNGCPDKTTLINPVVNLVNDFIDNVDDNSYSCNILSSTTDFTDEANLVYVYPNPSQNFITIKTKDDFEISTIQIFDIIGNEVIPENAHEQRIDVSQLSKGVYTLKIFSRKINTIIVKKFLLN